MNDTFIVEYVIDTYAAIEYLNGNKEYVTKLNGATKIYTNQFMLAELYFISLKRNGEEIANQHLAAFSSHCEALYEMDIKEAMKLRLKLKNRKLDVSYTDSIGYHLALKKKIEFLTGDSAFEKLPNVEFIK